MVVNHTSAFRPSSIIVMGTKKDLDANCKIDIDAKHRQIQVQNKGTIFNFPLSNLNGLFYHNAYFTYNYCLVEKLVGKYKTPPTCLECGHEIPIVFSTILGFKNDEFFYVCCPECKAIQSFYITRKSKDRKMISDKMVFLLKPLSVVAFINDYNAVYKVFPGSFRRANGKFLCYSSYFKSLTYTNYESKCLEFLFNEYDERKVKTLILNNGMEIDVAKEILKEEKNDVPGAKIFINPHLVSTIYLKSNLAYTVIHVINCDDRSIDFSGTCRTSLNAHAQRYKLLFTEINEIFVGGVIYKMDSVSFKI